ncbi:MAG TPA: hypothetical protein VMU84_12325 [Thermoanaerobaculia bacterium]|nr:hypothetical protein [Thermoanaerobaculia bacterium]
MRPLPILLLTFALACSHVDREAFPEREDEPGAAVAYYAMKRSGTDDPQRSYAIAREQMRRLPRTQQQADSATFPTAWQFLGPGNIGGRTRVLVIDPTNANTMYAGAVSGGIFKTTDAGTSWRAIGDELANLTVNSLAMSPRDRNVLFAGTGEGYFREEVRGTGLPLRGNGIFVTHNAGATWQQLASTANENFQWVNDLVVSTHDPNRIYAATRTGVWRSIDEGATWSHVLGTNVKGGCLDLAWRGDTNGDYLFASCGTFERATVYRTKNAESDDAWTSVLSEELMGRTSLAIAPSNPSMIYALSASNTDGVRFNQALHAVFRSDANGDPGTWNARVRSNSADYLSTLILTNPLGATSELCTPGSGGPNFTTMGWYCNTIAVDPLDPERVYAAGVDVFRSDDGGRTWGVGSYWWTGTNDPAFAHADQHSIVFHPAYDGAANQKMFATNDGGVFRTDNARSPVAKGDKGACATGFSQMAWTSLNHNYGATQFYHGAVFPDGTHFMAGAQDNGTLIGSTEYPGPDAWLHRIGGDGAYVAVDQVDPNHLYGEAQFGNLFHSFDGGYIFRSARRGLSDDFLFVTPFLIDPNEHSRLWIGGGHLWRSDDFAVNWSSASAVLQGQVTAIAVAPARSDRVLAGTNEGAIARNDSARTTRFDTVWPSTKPRDGWVSWIAFDPIDANVAYATYAGFGGEHVWKSIDGGATWSALSSNLPDIPVHAIAIDPTNRARLFLGTDLGVFVSLDGGASWSVENTGFAAVVTEAVVIARGAWGPAVYAFTHGRGAWRAELTAKPVKRRAR